MVSLLQDPRLKSKHLNQTCAQNLRNCKTTSRLLLLYILTTQNSHARSPQAIGTYIGVDCMVNSDASQFTVSML